MFIKHHTNADTAVAEKSYRPHKTHRWRRGWRDNVQRTEAIENITKYKKQKMWWI